MKTSLPTAILSAVFFLLHLPLDSVVAFVGQTATKSQQKNSVVTRTMAHLPLEEIGRARASVPLWFFGAAGSGGIARAAVPNLFKEWQYIQTLKDSQPTLGGPKLGLLTVLCGYPQDICIADAQAVVDNPLSIQEIVKRYPTEHCLSGEGGLLVREAFVRANEGKNPLAVYAVFDSLGKKAIEPRLAQQKIDSYKTDIAKISGNLVGTKVVVFSAVFLLLFLLGLADVATAYDTYRGYFPEWPGIDETFPWGLFQDPEKSILTIPQYWDASELRRE